MQSTTVEKNNKPLLSIGLSYVYDIVPDITDSQREVLEKSLDMYLSNQSSFNECSKVFENVIGSSKPVKRISSILNIPVNPIPNNSLAMHSYPNCRRKARCWTEYEDKRLLVGIHRYGLDDWQSVANFVGNSRSKSQCSQRWVRGLDPRISKEKWTPEDEKQLEELVNRYGSKSWTKIAQLMGNRSDVQCRYRYKQISNGANSSSSSASPEVGIVESKSSPADLLLNKSYIDRTSGRVELPSINSLLGAGTTLSLQANFLV